MGGFRKLYSNCYPFVSPREGESRGRYRDDQSEPASASDFVSIVDITYNGDPVLSRVVQGISGAGAPCGPLVDILDTTTTVEAHGVAIWKEEDDGPAVVTIQTKLPGESNSSSIRRDGRFWEALYNQVRVSWILIHKKTQRMVSIASWKPRSGLRHRPCDDDFLLRFGSILSTPASPVHCSITMRCKACIATSTSWFESQETHAETLVRITELGMHLEDIAGVHLRGQDAITLLARAMTCNKSAAESKVSATYHNFLVTQSSNREALIRRESRRETASAILFVGMLAILLSFFV